MRKDVVVSLGAVHSLQKIVLGQKIQKEEWQLWGRQPEGEGQL